MSGRKMDDLDVAGIFLAGVFALGFAAVFAAIAWDKWIRESETKPDYTYEGYGVVTAVTDCSLSDPYKGDASMHCTITTDQVTWRPNLFSFPGDVVQIGDTIGVQKGNSNRYAYTQHCRNDLCMTAYQGELKP